VEFVQADIRDAGAVDRASRGVEVVYHTVALVPLSKDGHAFGSVNREGTRNALEAARKAGVRKFVNLSSSAIFGVPPRNPVDESVEPHPREAYGRAKLAAEKECEAAVSRGLDVSIVRPRTILGHGRLGIMQVIFEWVRRGMNVPVLGDGSNLYQFVHADDLADAVIRAGQRAGPATYNVGAAEFGTMRQTLEGLIAHAGTRSRIVGLPRRPTIDLMRLVGDLGLAPLAPYHALMYAESMYFDIGKARKELDWTPRYGNVAMMCESYDWYLAHREELLRGSGEASHHRSPVEFGLLSWVGRLLSRM
jgi:nucleoside-diphosphate-sugar epimerase